MIRLEYISCALAADHCSYFFPQLKILDFIEMSAYMYFMKISNTKISILFIFIFTIAGIVFTYHYMNEHSHTGGEHLKLNEGGKWKADKNTLDRVEMMLNETDAIYSSPGSDKNKYHDYLLSMKNHYNITIDRCTMTGPAHEQLHVFLVQLDGKLNNLDTGIKQSDGGQMKSSIEEIYFHLKSFHNFFE